MLQVLGGPTKIEGAALSSNVSFRTSLKAELWLTWQRATRDPDDSLPWFIMDGVPLGMSARIPGSEPNLELSSVKHWHNFLTDERHRALRGRGRVAQGGRGRQMPEDGVGGSRERVWSDDRVASGPDRTGSRGRPEDPYILTLDLDESGGDNRAQAQERVVLPRGSDVVRSLRKAASWDGDQTATGSSERQELEFVTIEVRDLAGHFPVATEELRLCISRGPESGRG